MISFKPQFIATVWLKRTLVSWLLRLVLVCVCLIRPQQLALDDSFFADFLLLREDLPPLENNEKSGNNGDHGEEKHGHGQPDAHGRHGLAREALAGIEVVKDVAGRARVPAVGRAP